MDKTSQTTAPTTFDATGLVERIANTITAQIAETLDTDGLVDQSELRSVVDGHVAGVLQSLTEDGLTPVLEIAHEMVAAARTRDEQLLADPRYADAPIVTGTLVLQQWTGHKQDQLLEEDRVDVLLPAAWLARQDRGQLERSASQYVDKDWIVEGLGLLGDHHGPFELEIDAYWEMEKDLLELWLEATEV